MATIFPQNPQVNDEYQGYRFNGTQWEIIGIDLTQEYAELTSGYIADLVIPATIARVDDVNTSLEDYIPLNIKGEPLGVAELNASGYVPSSQLNLDLLPSQSNNTGKFLTTDGSIASWASVDALPLQSNNTGKFLTTDGSVASWATVDLTSYAPLNSPSLTTPNIGVATGTSLVATNNVVSHVDRVTPSFTSNVYTLNGTEDGNLVLLNNSSTDGTLYVPTDATYNFLKGTQITLVQSGTGQITIAAADSNTTTINYTPGNKLRAQWSGATLIKTTNNTWILMGDLSL
jgi:hypothetical protein